MAETEVDTERVSVRTYVPRYQREAWDDHAEELDMSRSEFVRTMVQAGRQAFDDDGSADETQQAGPDAPTDTDGSTADEPGGGSAQTVVGADIESQILEALSADRYLSWDELLAVVTEDIEDSLEDALQSMDRVVYSGRNGGYTIDE